MNFRFVFGFAILVLVFINLSPTIADSKSDLNIQQSGLECRLPIVQPWQKMPALFGFGAALYQENKKDERVTFTVIVTQYEGEALDDDGLKAEIKSFHTAKKEFIEEQGGEYLSPADSLLGEGASRLYRAAVNYRLDGVDYRDATYFRFVGGRLVHAKLMFPLAGFDEKIVDQQTSDLLAGMTCQKSSGQ